MHQTDKTRTIDTITQAGLHAARSYLDAVETLARSLSTGSPLFGVSTKPCCEIPPACWLPHYSGSSESRACPCGTALLRVQVSNCQAKDSQIRVRVDGAGDLGVKVTPESATLAPMERKWFTVAVTIPENTCQGMLYDLVIWVAGCNDHYARWGVRIADGASGTCNEIRVDDCPDYVHHWYDHFYCRRPCFSISRNRDEQRQGANQ